MPMSVPSPVRLFHITAVANLTSICAAGALLAKNLGTASGITYQNIAHQGAQGARSARRVPNPPGGTVHDYVPFYFAPRSPMLYAIHGSRVAGCTLKQAEIVHIETTVDVTLAGGVPFVIYDRNATFPYANAYTSVADLDKVAWDLICETPRLDGYCKYFHDVQGSPSYVDRLEQRMAEFLLRDRLPIGHIVRIGVANAGTRQSVLAILQGAGVHLPVEIKTDWYFLGQ